MSTDPQPCPCPVCKGDRQINGRECGTCDGTGEDLNVRLAIIAAAAAKATALAPISDEQIDAFRAAKGWAVPDNPEALALQRQAIKGLIKNDQGPDAALVNTTAHQLARPGDPYLVPRWDMKQGDVDQIDGHALATAFHEMAKFPPPPPPDSTTRQREAIGRSVAEYMTNAKSGDDADLVAHRIVAAVGPVEAYEMADVLAKWAVAIQLRAHKAEQMGLKR